MAGSLIQYVDGIVLTDRSAMFCGAKRIDTQKPGGLVFRHVLHSDGERLYLASASKGSVRVRLIGNNGRATAARGRKAVIVPAGESARVVVQTEENVWSVIARKTNGSWTRIGGDSIVRIEIDVAGARP